MDAFSSNWHAFRGISINELSDFIRITLLIINSKCSVEQTAGKHIPSEMLGPTSNLYVENILRNSNTPALIYYYFDFFFFFSLHTVEKSVVVSIFSMEISIGQCNIVFYNRYHFVWSENIVKMLPNQRNFRLKSPMVAVPMRLQLEKHKRKPEKQNWT